MKNFSSKMSEFVAGINEEGKQILVYIAIGLFFFISCCCESEAQGKYNVQGHNITSVSASKRESKATETEYTFTAKDGKTYPVYLSANGRAYINKVSSKTGNTYKMYLDEETSRTICNEMKVEYKPSNRK